VGAASSEDSEEAYTKRTLLAELRATRRLTGGLRLGAQLRVAHLAVEDLASGGLLDSGALVGSDGGAEVGVGPALILDLRDNDFAPRRGPYLELSSHFHLDALGSWTNQAHVIDARHYIDMGGRHVLAGQLYAKFTSGDVPFDSLAKLGGAARMRGFYEGRFRDRHMAIAQLDYRSPFWWRFAGALFVAAGAVAPALTDFSLRDGQLAGGAGLRFMLSAKDRAALRLDLAATGGGEMGVYLQLGEAF
jgi:outer membrane protein assembly factor BamA